MVDQIQAVRDAIGTHAGRAKQTALNRRLSRANQKEFINDQKAFIRDQTDFEAWLEGENERRKKLRLLPIRVEDIPGIIKPSYQPAATPSGAGTLPNPPQPTVQTPATDNRTEVTAKPIATTNPPTTTPDAAPAAGKMTDAVAKRIRGMIDGFQALVSRIAEMLASNNAPIVASTTPAATGTSPGTPAGSRYEGLGEFSSPATPETPGPAGQHR